MPNGRPARAPTVRETDAMGFLGYLLSMALSGLIIGALARLVIPGPNPMSIGMTILVGLGGAFLGGIVAAIFQVGLFLTLVLEVAAAAVIVHFMTRRPYGRF